ncbi:MAG: glycosyltransferase family 2 protein [Prevotella sp.]|nr:glycosyltransferase family 2 protein [Prevotella sp.]
MAAKITIIIPTYKPDSKLKQCIDSIAMQTMDHSMLEVIIVLNGCDEPYRSLINDYVQPYSDFNVIILQSNIAGVSNARNIGLEKAQGDYICFIDDDDWISENYLNLLFEISSEDTIAEANFLQINNTTREQVSHFLTTAYADNIHKVNPSLWSLRSLLSSACGKLIPRHVIGDVRFDTSFRLGEDSLFMFALSNRIRAISLSSPDAVYYIRQHEKSASRSSIRYSEKVQILSRLIIAYIRQWMQQPLDYNFLFFSTRIFATIVKFFIRDYR